MEVRENVILKLVVCVCVCVCVWGGGGRYRGIGNIVRKYVEGNKLLDWGAPRSVHYLHSYNLLEFL